MATGTLSALFGIGAIPTTLIVALAALFWPWPQLLAYDGDEAQDLEAPIRRATDDLFHREQFVRFIVAQLTLPGVRCPRIAITGSVGTGKTSVANLIIERLEADAHLVVRFDPWHHSDRSNCRDALLTAIEDAMLPRPRYRGVLVRQRLFLRRVWGKLVDEVAWIDLLGSHVERRLALGQGELGAALRTALPPGKRLIVFVDDLERCAAEVALDLLMNVKEVVNAPGLAYLLAFDEKRLIEQQADEVFPGDDPAHLDKVIDLRLELPLPRAEDESEARQRFGAAIAQGSALNLDAVELISDVLPRSLRNQKRFLLFAAARLSHLPARPDWLQLDERFLVVLLLTEFFEPGFLDRGAESEPIQSDLDSGVLRETVRATNTSSRGRTRTEDPEPPFSPGSDDGRAAYARARDIGNEAHNSRGHIAWLRGEGLSYDEEIFHKLARGLRPGVTVNNWLPVLTEESPERLLAMLGATSRIRERLLEIVADVPTAAEQDDTFSLMTTVESGRREILAELNRRGVQPGPVLFSGALSSLSRWGHFGGPYVEHLEEEARFAHRLAETAGPAAMEYVAALGHRPSTLDGPGFSTFQSQLKTILLEQAADQLEVLFSEPGGVESLAEAWSNRQENSLVFDLSSPFHSADRRARLLDLADEAEPEVQKNFIWFLRILNWWTGQRNQPLAEHDSWIANIWSAAVRAPLNRRIMGELDQARSFFIERGVSEAHLPLPPWWLAHLAEHERKLSWDLVSSDSASDKPPVRGAEPPDDDSGEAAGE
ncbi:MAG: P-loop NTPase fold protein [Armatimonadota bacterium]